MQAIAALRSAELRACCAQVAQQHGRGVRDHLGHGDCWGAKLPDDALNGCQAPCHLTFAATQGQPAPLKSLTPGEQSRIVRRCPSAASERVQLHAEEIRDGIIAQSLAGIFGRILLQGGFAGSGIAHRAYAPVLRPSSSRITGRQLRLQSLPCAVFRKAIPFAGIRQY